MNEMVCGGMNLAGYYVGSDFDLNLNKAFTVAGLLFKFCTSVCAHVHTYIYIYIYIDVYVYSYMNADIFIHINVQIL